MVLKGCRSECEREAVNAGAMVRVAIYSASAVRLLQRRAFLMKQESSKGEGW